MTVPSADEEKNRSIPHSGVSMQPTARAIAIASLLFFATFALVSFAHGFLVGISPVDASIRANPVDSERFYLASLSCSLLVGAALSLFRSGLRLRLRDKFMCWTLLTAAAAGLCLATFAPEPETGTTAVSGVLVAVIAGTIIGAIIDRKSRAATSCSPD